MTKPTQKPIFLFHVFRCAHRYPFGYYHICYEPQLWLMLHSLSIISE